MRISRFFAVRALAVAALLAAPALVFPALVRAQGMPPIPVTVAEPLAKRITQWDEFHGRFEAIESVEVRARVSGFIDQVHFKDGQTVQAGDLLFTIDQRPFLQAQVGVKELYKPCPSMFTCGTPYGVSTGSEIQSKSSMRKAQELLKQSGYDGTPVVIMKPTDLASIDKLPEVAAQLMRQAGFKVDLQAMDWQTLVGRRAKKDAPDKGGWHMFLTAWQAFDVWSPIANPTTDTRGEKSTWFGWATDEQMVGLRDQFMRATDDATKKKLADQMHARMFEIGTHVILGEYQQPMAARKNISGFFITNGNIYWNLKKN